MLFTFLHKVLKNIAFNIFDFVVWIILSSFVEMIALNVWTVGSYVVFFSASPAFLSSCFWSCISVLFELIIICSCVPHAIVLLHGISHRFSFPPLFITGVLRWSVSGFFLSPCSLPIVAFFEFRCSCISIWLVYCCYTFCFRFDFLFDFIAVF